MILVRRTLRIHHFINRQRIPNEINLPHEGFTFNTMKFDQTEYNKRRMTAYRSRLKFNRVSSTKY